MSTRQQQFEAVFATLGQPHRGSFVRAIPLEYQNSPLDSIGSSAGRRYNAATTFRMLYLGENTDTVARETRLIVQDKDGNDVAHPQAPKIIMTVEYELQRVTDLTDPTILALLGVNASSLVTEWTDDLKAGKVPITQVLGAAAHAVGLEGLIVPSMRHPGRTNIAVVEANLLVGSYIQIHNPVGFGPAITTRVDGTK